MDIVSPDLASYDHIIVAVSGGKDGTACLLALLEAGAPAERIELWHHEVDGAGRSFMNWPSTGPYVEALARDFGLPLYRSWREGGFEREMLRHDMPTAPVVFETPEGRVVVAMSITGDRYISGPKQRSGRSWSAGASCQPIHIRSDFRACPARSASLAMQTSSPP